MLRRAQDRGVEVVNGVAEFLPFKGGRFDTAMIVTTTCLVDDVSRTLVEVERVLGNEGTLVIGYIDSNSPIGEIYRANADESPFYGNAVFVTTEELLDHLEAAGFTDFEIVQTVFREVDEIDAVEPIEEGYGEGSFVGIKATR